MSSTESYDADIVDISEFFNSGSTDSSATSDEPEQKSTFGEVDSPIKELKAIILSLDWEITDEIADSFIAEVDRLAEVWNNDKVVVAFLQILRALGKYLRTHKADAHPDSVNLLYSVYNNFEKIVLTDEISPEQEKIIFEEELHKFTNLKKKIAQAAAAFSTGEANESLLSAIKSVLLEIDWNINDQTMQKFDIEINKLEKIWSTDRNILTPLQMMRAIGSYINKRKQNSHPDSIKLLTTVFKNFEKMALGVEMSEEEKQALVEADLVKFTELKQHILADKQQEIDNKDVVAEAILANEDPTELPGQMFEESESASNEEIGFVAPIGSSAPDNHEDETSEEVGNRLDNLFGLEEESTPAVDSALPAEASSDGVMPLPGGAGEDEIFPLPGGDEDVIPLHNSGEEVVPLPPGDGDDDEVMPLHTSDEEVFPLPGGDSDEDVFPLPGGDSDEVVPLHTDNEEIIPLPGESNEEVMPIIGSEEVITTLPAGDSDEIYTFSTDDESDAITPLPGMGQAEDPSGQVSEGIDNHIDNFFGDDSDSEQLDSSRPTADIPVLATEINTKTLLELLNSNIYSPEQLDLNSLSSEISNLETTFSSNLTLQLFLGPLNSMVVYLKLTKETAHPDSLSLLHFLATSLSEAEQQNASQSDQVLKIFKSALDKFSHFQESIIFPALSSTLSREKEIKNILGVE